MTASVFYFTDSAGFGGAEQVLLTLWEGLDRRRWRPLLIHHPEPGVEPLLQAARRLEVDLWAVPRLPEGRLGAQRVLPFAQALRRRRPALFHANLAWQLAGKFGMAAAALAGLPVLATEHLFVETPTPAATVLQHRMLAAGVRRYLPVSHALSRRLQRALGLPARKLQVIHNGIPVERFQAPPRPGLRQQLGLEAGRPVILTPARLDAQKGLSYLVPAAAQVPEALFLLAGEGPERAALTAQVQAAGLAERVRLLGRRADLADWLAACDIVVLPSLYEGFPLVVLEALAAGKPVVATDIEGTREAVSDGRTGVLVPPADPEALARAVRRLLADPAWAGQLAAAGRAEVQTCFSAAAMVAAVTQVYTEILDGRA